MIDFPASPTVGQSFTVGSTTWSWDGTKWTAATPGASSGFAESVSWLAGVNPNNAIVFSNDTGRTLTVTAIMGMTQVVNTTAMTIDVYKATSAQSALASGTKLSTTASMTATETVGTGKTMLSGGTTTLAAGDRLGVVASGTPDNSIAAITVYMQ